MHRKVAVPQHYCIARKKRCLCLYVLLRVQRKVKTEKSMGSGQGAGVGSVKRTAASSRLMKSAVVGVRVKEEKSKPPAKRTKRAKLAEGGGPAG